MAMGIMEASKAAYSLEKMFPQGITVLAVDNHPSLGVLETLLKDCGYIVVTAQHAHAALSLLEEKNSNYDLVIADVNMPDMDGFKLLEIVSSEMDLPVILSSEKDDADYVIRGILHGAADCLVKPLKVGDVKLIWKHVLRKRISKDPRDKNGKRKINDLMPNTVTNHVVVKKEEPIEESNDEPRQTRKRLIWNAELHDRFVTAYNLLGPERATPKRILEYMNVQELTRQNVASHLQRYRQALSRNGNGAVPHHSRYGSSSNGFGADRRMPLEQHRSAHNILNPVSSHSYNLRRRPLASQPTQLGMMGHAAVSRPTQLAAATEHVVPSLPTQSAMGYGVLASQTSQLVAGRAAASQPAQLGMIEQVLFSKSTQLASEPVLASQPTQLGRMVHTSSSQLTQVTEHDDSNATVATQPNKQVHSSDLGQCSGFNTLGRDNPNSVTTGQVEGSINSFHQKPWTGGGDLRPVPSFQMQGSSSVPNCSSSLAEDNLLKSLASFLLDDQPSFDKNTPAHFVDEELIAKHVDTLSATLEGGCEDMPEGGSLQTEAWKGPMECRK